MLKFIPEPAQGVGWVQVWLCRWIHTGLTGILFFLPFQGDDGDYSHGWNYWLVQLFCFQDLYLCLSHGGPAAARGLPLRVAVRSLRPHLRLLNRLWGPKGKSQLGTWTWTRNSCKQLSRVAIMKLRPVWITWNNGKCLVFTFLGPWILFSMTWGVQSFNTCSCLSSSCDFFPIPRYLEKVTFGCLFEGCDFCSFRFVL